MTLIRLILGKLILFLDWVFTPGASHGNQPSKPSSTDKRHA